jgi:predicted GNAT superfamily acetyltransferase
LVTNPLRIRPITTIDECRAVAALEREVWGYEDGEDIVPPPVLIVSIKRGGVLLGAFDESNAIKGFVYSVPALKEGRLTQWSHMLGVASEARGKGLGFRLKLAQREHALTLGIELIEWTFDPLQALNAHMNFARLGVLASEYEENIYGDSSSRLHRGTPTDRLIAEWHLTRPHVERRLFHSGQPLIRDGSIASAPVVNPALAGSDWPKPGSWNSSMEERRILMEIPTGFGEMLIRDAELALAWRLHTREILQAYFQRGYRAVDFFLSREAGRGQYLLAQSET